MKENIGIRVAEKPVRMWDFNAAENEFSVGSKTMDIIAIPNARKLC